MSTSSPPPSSTTTPPEGLLCNTSINGKQYYTSVFADIGNVLKAQAGVAFNIFSGMSALCCCLLFSVLALTLQGPTNIGTILVYLCLACQIFGMAYSAYMVYNYKNTLKKIVAESKPCINDPDLDKKK